MFLYSAMLNEEDPHVRGVGILFNKDTKNALLEWNPVSERIRMESCFGQDKNGILFRRG
jgi:hypothetical protein